MNDLLKKIVSYLPNFQIGLQKKFDQLFGPQLNHPYFLNKKKKPYRFNWQTNEFTRVNAAWMADAALLAYVPNHLDDFDNFKLTKEQKTRCKSGLVKERLKRAGMNRVKFFNNNGTQCFVADNDDWVAVSFRGTEVNETIDVGNDLGFLLKKEGKGSVHKGFQAALDAVWKSEKNRMGVEEYLKRASKNGTKPVFMTGHSLGAAIALIAAARWKKQHSLRGVYTFGSPGVGNKAFVDGLENCNAIRFVHNEDMVTKVSQDPEFYHVGKLYMIDDRGKVQPQKGRSSDMTKIWKKAGQILSTEASKFSFRAVQIPRCLADHSPKFYSDYIRKNAP